MRLLYCSSFNVAFACVLLLFCVADVLPFCVLQETKSKLLKRKREKNLKLFLIIVMPELKNRPCLHHRLCLYI